MLLFGNPSPKVTLTYSDTTVTAKEPFLLTITGPDLLSGTFTDARGYHGTWTAQADVLTLAYWDWQFYVLNGTVYGLGYRYRPLDGRPEQGSPAAPTGSAPHS